MEDLKPKVDVTKRTTKVNISMIIGVLLFFIVGAALYLYFRSQN